MNGLFSTGKRGDVNLGKFAEAESHQDEISYLYDGFYAVVDISYRYSNDNPEDDFHKYIIAILSSNIGPENFV